MLVIFWWRQFNNAGGRLVTSILETKCVDDNYTMLVTVLAMTVLVTNIHSLFILASGTNIQKMSPTSKFCHQDPKFITKLVTPTLVINITVIPNLFNSSYKAITCWNSLFWKRYAINNFINIIIYDIILEMVWIEKFSELTINIRVTISLSHFYFKCLSIVSFDLVLSF